MHPLLRTLFSRDQVENSGGPLTLKILVADDEDVSRRTLVYLLEASGYAVVDARDGVEAVQKAIRELPDAILMDIAMPIMDGCQAAETLRANARTSGIPIIACTGAPRPLSEWNHLFQAVIGKPFTAEGVVNEIQKVATRPSIN
jgi:CheY-like chemotaxis protein